jgi:SAM-dependent methyltransferase
LNSPRAEPVEAWNHNIAYFPFIEQVAKEKPRRSAIDVGTGDGMLAARLAGFIPSVVGVDAHHEQVDGAATTYTAPGLRFVLGDILETRLDDEPYDFVACSSTLHHLPLEAGIARLKELTAPGGTLVVVGLANNSTLGDWLLEAVRLVPVRIARAGRGWHEHGAPKLDPTETISAMRDAFRSALPGSTFRRRLYWRYSLVWNRPAAENSD